MTAARGSGIDASQTDHGDGADAPLLPSGEPCNRIDGLDVTLIDNGMPVVLVAAAALGKTGYESPQDLESDATLRRRVESIRRQAGPMMHLGDVSEQTVPKVCLLAAPRHGGTVSTRTFIPHRVHQAIGVLGAVSVASACVIPQTVAARVAAIGAVTGTTPVRVEHPGGRFSLQLESGPGGADTVRRAALLRTARKLMAGEVFVPASVWRQR
ncbi:MAG: PrpF domain-containing protein [Pseudomonadota bacterium]